MLGAREQLRQVLFRLADIFAGDAGEIDAVERQGKPRRQPADGERLAGARRPDQERAHARPIARARGRAEPIDERVARDAARRQRLDLAPRRCRQHQRGIGNRLRQQLGERPEIAARAAARGERHVGGGEALAAAQSRLEAAGACKVGDAPGRVTMRRARACARAPPHQSPQCHSATRSSAHGTGTRQLGRVSPSRSKLPSGPAAISQARASR